MRKALVALAVSAAMWAGQAQAAVYFLDVSGSIDRYLGHVSNPAPNLFPAPPIGFSFTIAITDGVALEELDGRASADYSATASNLIFTGLSESYTLESTALSNSGFTPSTGQNSAQLYNWHAIRGTIGGSIFQLSFRFDAPNSESLHLIAADDAFTYTVPGLYIERIAMPFQAGNYVGVFTNVSIRGESPEVPVQAVPEPATWAMMIAGFGLVGGAMRRRTTNPRASSSSS